MHRNKNHLGSKIKMHTETACVGIHLYMHVPTNFLLWCIFSHYILKSFLHIIMLEIIRLELYETFSLVLNNNLL